MDNFTMPDSAFAADKASTEKELKDLRQRVSDLENIVHKLVLVLQSTFESADKVGKD